MSEFYDRTVCIACGMKHSEDNWEKCFLNPNQRTKEQYLKDLELNNKPFPNTKREIEWFLEYVGYDYECLKGFISHTPDIFNSIFSFTLAYYFIRNIKLGKTEFRISFQDDKKFIIHPLNKDGETLDLSI